jgi:methionine-rich copper-binding protein CopC
MLRSLLALSVVTVFACSGPGPGGDDAGTGGGAQSGGGAGGGGGGGVSGGGAGGGGEIDTTAPEVLATVPSDNAADVPNSSVLQVLFTEPMGPSSVTLSVTPGVTLGPASWNAGGTLATWTPAAVLPLGTSFTATATGADLAGNALATPYVFSFSTAALPDTEAPTLESSSPASGATGVAPNTRLRLTFSEPMATGSVAVATTPAVAQGTGTWTDGDRTVTWNTPAASWSAATSYRVQVTGTDLAGNALADAGLSFTTSATTDTTPPAIVASTPDAGATNVGTATRLSLTFSEQMAAASVVVATTPTTSLGQPTWSNSNRTATWGSPLMNWAAGTSYAVRVSGRDLASNAMAPDAGFSFSTGATGDTTPPTVLSTSPTNGAANVSRLSSIRITFSEPMDRLATQAAIATSPTVSCSWAWNSTDTGLTCTPGFLQLPLGTITVTIGTGARDKAGNAMARAYTFAFSTL